MRVSLFALLIGAVFGALATFQPVSDSDLFWHLETGRRTIAGDLPRTDVFSWTITGAPVLTDQWLGDALFALARAFGDWRGVLALRALVVAALVTTVVDTTLVAGRARPVVAVAAAFPAIALSRFAWTDRPELLGLLCFAVLVRLLRGGDRALLASLVLLWIWAQLHGSYALGLGLVLASCGARALEETRERWRFVPIAGAAVLATLLTPAGLAAWTSAGGHFLAPPRFIAEEGVPDVRSLPGLLFVGTLALVIAVAALLRRPASPRDLAVLLPVTFVSLSAARYTPLLAIAAAPFLAERFVDPLAAWRSGPQMRAIGTRARAAVVAAVLVVLALFVAVADGHVDESGFPRGALVAVPPGPGLFNRYEWGGWLMYAAPSTPVFIDGRLFPYVPRVLDDYRAILNAHPGWEADADRLGVRTMLVRPDDPIAVRAPERGWRVAYADAIAVVLVR